MQTFSGTIVDPLKGRIFFGTLTVEAGKIVAVTEDPSPKGDGFILPGFVDAHVHVESSMLIPSEFARLAVPHGTVATVSDPHEIGNVLGVAGVEFMIENGKQVPFHFYFGVPSCVPATCMETSGASITADDIEMLFQKHDLKYLSEVMNYPGVIHRDPEVMAKIEVAKKYKKRIDGHSPGIVGDPLKRYSEAGITTDHECFTLSEAKEKLACGMSVLIREGSAAKNFEELHSLITEAPNHVMLCSDDKHPHELIKGHINQLVTRALFDKKHDLMDVLKAACVNPVLHYGLDVGLLRVGDSADFIRIDSLNSFKVLETYINGQLVAKDGKPLISSIPSEPLNHFRCDPKQPDDFKIDADGINQIKVIVPLENQLVTESAVISPKIVNGALVADPENNLLKLTVVNRYRNAPPAVGFIQNFGLRQGALGSCIAHDSHNIIAVGCTDEALAAAINAIIRNQGGIAVVDGHGEISTLPLPIAGIMSAEPGELIAQKYIALENKAKALGSQLHDPFMTLSFMALLVIPKLKLSDQGLFDGEAFSFTSLKV
jgi:adenine deaminase